MTLKLPTPLPYDFVDQMLDEELKFGSDQDDDTIIWWCYRRDTDPKAGRFLTSNYGRQMFELLDDHEDKQTEDAEGYVTVYHLSKGMCWTATELTDEEVDSLLHLETG